MAVLVPSHEEEAAEEGDVEGGDDEDDEGDGGDHVQVHSLLIQPQHQVPPLAGPRARVSWCGRHVRHLTVNWLDVETNTSMLPTRQTLQFRLDR